MQTKTTRPLFASDYAPARKNPRKRKHAADTHSFPASALLAPGINRSVFDNGGHRGFFAMLKNG